MQLHDEGTINLFEDVAFSLCLDEQIALRYNILLELLECKKVFCSSTFDKINFAK